MAFSTRAWAYTRRGPINSVLKLKKIDVTPKADDVVVQVTAAPLHRTDAAIINGTALGRAKPVTGTLIGGSEGVGKVDKAGTSKVLKTGDTVWVSPINGCWSEKVAVSGSAVHKIAPEHAELATFASSLVTANQLLKGIQKGDAVVQSGGSGLISLAVSALAKQKGITVYTTSTSGDRLSASSQRHKGFGSEVFEASPAGKRKLQSALGKSNVRLFLNGGGKYFNDFSKLVADNGTVITYGAQSGRSLTFAPGPMIYKNLTLSTFYLPTALSALTYEERQALLDSTLKAFAESKFTYPTQVAKGLDAFADVWDSTFVKGGSKGVLKF
eukprot:GILI01012542.1.p1 GENE.GILI01012542.1~~GILI01012542.1.p1  ORF type:complete len:343 (+),score=92.52 GILI01012542.1:50-1030(+)